MISEGPFQPLLFCDSVLVLSVAELGTGTFLTHEELSPRALFSVPQGERRISKGGATGTGQL